jgi:hypothetical protein
MERNRTKQTQTMPPHSVSGRKAKRQKQKTKQVFAEDAYFIQDAMVQGLAKCIIFIIV